MGKSLSILFWRALLENEDVSAHNVRMRVEIDTTCAGENNSQNEVEKRGRRIRFFPCKKNVDRPRKNLCSARSNDRFFHRDDERRSINRTCLGKERNVKHIMNKMKQESKDRSIARN